MKTTLLLITLCVLVTGCVSVPYQDSWEEQEKERREESIRVSSDLFGQCESYISKNNLTTVGSRYLTNVMGLVGKCCWTEQVFTNEQGHYNIEQCRGFRAREKELEGEE